MLSLCYKSLKNSAPVYLYWRVWMVESGRPEGRELQQSMQDRIRETTSLAVALVVRYFLI